MGIQIIAIILFILFTIEIVYIFMYSENNNPVQQNISSGGINLPPLPPPPSSNLGIGTIRTNRPYTFDSDFDNGGIITSDIDYVMGGRRGRGTRGRGRRGRGNQNEHLTNIEFYIGNHKNDLGKKINSNPNFDSDNDDDYRVNLRNEDKNKKLFIKFHIHTHGNNRDRNHRHRNHRHRNNRHRNDRHGNNRDDDDDNNFNIKYRIKNENNENILDRLDLSGKFNYDNENQTLKIGKISDISEISDTIKIKIDLE